MNQEEEQRKRTDFFNHQLNEIIKDTEIKSNEILTLKNKIKSLEDKLFIMKHTEKEENDNCNEIDVDKLLKSNIKLKKEKDLLQTKNKQYLDRIIKLNQVKIEKMNGKTKKQKKIIGEMISNIQKENETENDR